MFVVSRRAYAAALVVLAAGSSVAVGQAPRVGPPKGTLVVVGGGSMGPEIYSRFIEAAGGPDALIIDVPTAGGDSVYGQDAPGTRGWKTAGAKNVYVLHTKDRKLADSDSFAAIVAKAGGVWFEGGRQFHLWDSYGGTKTEKAFHDVLARGGVIGGSSAGASIIGSFMVRGAPSSNNMIMYYPGYEKGFGFLRNTGVDQHVVARERLPDLADSIIPKFPTLLGISEDEGTAWVIKGDTGTIIGRSKAFVYGANVTFDAGKPFLTLHPGDRYDLAARKILRRAAEGTSISESWVDELFKKYANPSAGGATVLVARDGNVLVNKSYGVGPQARYMPATTVPQFAVGGITEVFSAICAQLPEAPAGGRAGGGGRGAAAGTGTAFQNCVNRRVKSAVGMQKTTATAEDQIQSNVDELYRLALGLQNPRTYTAGEASAPQPIDYTRGWQADSFSGTSRYSAWGAPGGKRAAFVRVPDRRAAIIVLTNDDSFDAKDAANKILERLLK
jgi:cyanophycinase